MQCQPEAKVSGGCRDIKNYINEVCLVAEVKIVNYRSFVEVSEFRHIICFVKFSRVDFINIIRVNDSFL